MESCFVCTLANTKRSRHQWLCRGFLAYVRVCHEASADNHCRMRNPENAWRSLKATYLSDWSPQSMSPLSGKSVRETFRSKLSDANAGAFEKVSGAADMDTVALY